MITFIITFLASIILLPILLLVLLIGIIFSLVMYKARGAKSSIFKEKAKPKGTIEILPAEKTGDEALEEMAQKNRKGKFGKDKFKEL